MRPSKRQLSSAPAACGHPWRGNWGPELPSQLAYPTWKRAFGRANFCNRLRMYVRPACRRLSPGGSKFKVMKNGCQEKAAGMCACVRPRRTSWGSCTWGGRWPPGRTASAPWCRRRPPPGPPPPARSTCPALDWCALRAPPLLALAQHATQAGEWQHLPSGLPFHSLRDAKSRQGRKTKLLTKIVLSGTVPQIGGPGNINRSA